MDLKYVLQRIPGVNRRFVYYLEAHGYIKPTRLQKTRIARRDYSEEDLQVIQETWRYYTQGFSLQAAYSLAVEKERTVSYVTFQLPTRGLHEALERLKGLPGVVGASAVYADTADVIVKMSTPQEADLYHTLVPLFAQVGIAGVPQVWRTTRRFVKDQGDPRKEDKPGMIAYVLIRAPGKNVNEVMDNLKQLDGVVEAGVVYGESDIIARLEVRSQNALDTLVMERIHGIPDVESTRTYIVIGGMTWSR
ncbi:MAG: Lrp/AsnC ligand binding domain-containing protein [Chloroflexi bacterium]|nr:Lrp/AsnC ligand binding domain-containing protein [Chloroflexota bacterium]